MGPYSSDPGASRSPQSVPTSGTPAWSGSGMPDAPAWSGQYSGVPAAPPSMGAMSAVQERDTKWPALRLIANILKIIAWIEGGLGVIGALVAGGSLAATVGGAGFLVVLVLLVWVAVGFLVTYASSEIIMLFISIEKNTRQR